ncbi:hypothetical protein [Actinomyces bowdenii]|nr:hypothetical protein [Actinomyces bowdenii]
MSTSTSRRPLGFLSAPPAAPRLPEAQVPSLYRKYRLSVFMGIFIGYAGF